MVRQAFTGTFTTVSIDSLFESESINQSIKYPPFPADRIFPAPTTIGLTISFWWVKLSNKSSTKIQIGWKHQSDHWSISRWQDLPDFPPILILTLCDLCKKIDSSEERSSGPNLPVIQRKNKAWSKLNFPMNRSPFRSNKPSAANPSQRPAGEWENRTFRLAMENENWGRWCCRSASFRSHFGLNFNATPARNQLLPYSSQGDCNACPPKHASWDGVFNTSHKS